MGADSIPEGQLPWHPILADLPEDAIAEPEKIGKLRVESRELGVR
jgi:hypothetical protein